MLDDRDKSKLSFLILRFTFVHLLQKFELILLMLNYHMSWLGLLQFCGDNTYMYYVSLKPNGSMNLPKYKEIEAHVSTCDQFYQYCPTYISRAHTLRYLLLEIYNGHWYYDFQANSCFLIEIFLQTCWLFYLLTDWLRPIILFVVPAEWWCGGGQEGGGPRIMMS